MALTNETILDWINDGGLEELATEVAATSPYAIDPMTGLSQLDVLLMIADELRGIKQELRELK